MSNAGTLFPGLGYGPPAAAIAGLIADSSAHVIDSFIADADMPPGVVVCTGAIARASGQIGSCKVPGAAADVTAHFLGITCWSSQLEPPASGANIWKAKSIVPVMRVGRIWASAEAAIAVGVTAIYALYATANFGFLRADANTNQAALIPGGIRIRIPCTGADIVQIEINSP